MLKTKPARRFFIVRVILFKDLPAQMQNVWIASVPKRQKTILVLELPTINCFKPNCHDKSSFRFLLIRIVVSKLEKVNKKLKESRLRFNNLRCLL